MVPIKSICKLLSVYLIAAVENDFIQQIIALISEMITIRFAGWISGRIVSLEPDTDIQKLLPNGNQTRIRLSETVLSIFRGFRSDFWKNLHIAQSFNYHLQKHLFSVLCHDSKSVYGVSSVL